ncbi:MAG TPA: 30S ribosomal protein S17 [Candidatus Poseidoniaceae archaeon]|jgi:small subunit ribosomal protein S17|nr:30S ribosomal protein S17 [Candidatus Poseidoniaceae archaeon]
MRDIGIDVKMPSGEWDGDVNCPFNGTLRLRGQLFEGVVSSVGMSKSIIVELQKVRYMPKYERYEKRTSKIPAHLPSCIGDLAVGDRVKIMECRPISKTVSFCVVEGGESQ